MGNIFAPLALCITVISCGPTKTKQEKINWAEPVFSNEVVFLEKSDLECDNPGVYASIESLRVIRFYDGYEKKLYLNFKNQIQNYILKNPSGAPISETVYNEVYNKYFYLRPSGGNDDYNVTAATRGEFGKKQKAGKPFKICNRFSYYSADELENVGLNVSEIITRVYKKLINIPMLKNLEAVRLNIQPKLKRTFRYLGGEYNKKQFVDFMVDNAFYNPRKKEIAFLPQSKNQSQKEVGLWEMPMVAAHEYGHHVFRSIGDLNKSNEPFYGCFHAHQFNSNKNTRTANWLFANRAINEGFADLIALYTLREKESSLKGIKCLEKNREVKSSKFGDGSLKIYSKAAQEIMDSTQQFEADNNCDTPDFQYIHQVGAVFAHNLDKLFSELSENKTEKLKMLSSFLFNLKINNESLKSETPGQYLFHALSIGYREALKSKNIALDSSHCEKIKAIFDNNPPYSTCRFL